MHHLDHTKNIIEISHITFAYGDQIVLEDVSLNVHLGDFLGIVGPNGSGKTTLLKIILGLLKPTLGTVRLFDTLLQDYCCWSDIGYVPQKATNFDQNFPATVKEVVLMGRYASRGLLRLPTQEDTRLVDESLHQVGMADFKNRLIGELSGGQQQRVFIARALVSQPKVIFLDEPTVGVDLATQEQFYQLLKKLNTELDLTLVLVSHDLDIVRDEATEVACINKTLIYHGPPKTLTTKNYFEELYGKNAHLMVHNH